MSIDAAIVAAERTDAARRLIARAQAEAVDLVTVSALEPCVLGGPRHPLFEENAARARVQLSARRRKKIIDSVTGGMAGRGMLIDSCPRPGSRQRGGTYSLKPAPGVMLAARCRPSPIAVIEAEGLLNPA